MSPSDAEVQRLLQLALPAMQNMARELMQRAASSAVLPIPTPRPATVSAAGSDNITVRVDGDTNALTAQNLTGQWLPANQRVMVMFVPPQGLFVVGIIGGTSGLIAYTAYQPANTGPSTSSTTFVDVDATNLVVSFVAPKSGKALVVMTALAGFAGAGGTNGYWGLRSGTTNVTNSGRLAVTASAQTAPYRFLATGLTPGTSYTWKWTQRVDNGASTIATYYGTDYGQALMEVYGVLG